MSGVLTGFSIIAVIIAAGYLVARTNIAGPQAGRVLNRVAFFVTTPALLFTIMARADLRTLFSTGIVVALVSAISMMIVYFVIAKLVWKQPLPETVIGSMASGYVNSNNIGLPVAVYILGDAQSVAPVLLLQLLVFTPLCLSILDVSTRGTFSLRDVALQPFRNPIIIASLLGVVVSAVGIDLPVVIMEPLDLIGGAAIPLILMAFGFSLRGQRPFLAGTGRTQIALATGLKSVVMPAVAYLFAHFALGMDGEMLFSAVALAALPTAQNIFNFASRFERGEILARDTVLLTTIAAIPVFLLLTLLLRS